MAAFQEDIRGFNTAEVCEFLKEKISEINESTIDVFRKNKISGEVFLSLTNDEIAYEICCTLGEFFF